MSDITNDDLQVDVDIVLSSRVGDEDIKFYDDFFLTPNGLVITGTPSFEDWVLVGTSLKQIAGAVQFWIGDWLNYGRHAYGEKYTLAAETLGLDIGTLANYASTAKHVEPSSRDETVGYKIHEAVAPLAPADQKRWLARARAEQMTVAGVRAGIRAEQRTAKPSPPMNPRALWLWGRLGDFEREGLFQQNVNELLQEMTESMQADVRRLAPLVATWLQEISPEILQVEITPADSSSREVPPLREEGTSKIVDDAEDDDPPILIIEDGPPVVHDYIVPKLVRTTKHYVSEGPSKRPRLTHVTVDDERLRKTAAKDFQHADALERFGEKTR